MKNLYEEFHKDTTLQKKIISKSNFTYRIILNEINNLNLINSKILDIGCGAGTIDFYLASKGNTVLGIDISKNSIECCKESAKVMKLEDNTNFRVMNFPDEYPKDKFDFILCEEVLEHLEDDKGALEVMFSLLLNDGFALITVPSLNAPLYKLGLVKKFDQRVGHLRRYSTKEILDKCQKANFKIIFFKKKESILRNFLFLNPLAGKIIKFIRGPISDFVSFIDDLLVPVFGESDLIILLKKE